MKGYRGNYRYTEQDIVAWAKEYVNLPLSTFLKLENTLGVPHSTLWWCFMNRLPHIDFPLYRFVTFKIQDNMKRRGRKKKISSEI